ncbi:MAG: hypothetical protein K0Q64_2018, partial [Nitrobacter vulgaris]|nr:hypothetical protein [Nitrobacter vulgaris]
HLAFERLQNRDYAGAFDVIDQLAQMFPTARIDILAAAYDFYQMMPSRSRYDLYQSRYFDFLIRPGDKVLDIGSGHLPFPLATHLADITLTDHSYGRAGTPFKHVDGKPVYEVDVESTGFADKEFDFVYCSHVLEHARDPAAACRELMRIAKRGYIETPRHGKDIFLNTGKTSQHRWSVENVFGTLVFTEYTEEDLEGLGCDVLLDMHCAPATDREKAFSALIYLRAPQVNTMVMWSGDFPFEIRSAPAKQPAVPDADSGTVQVRPEVRRLKFLQVHTFYDVYLDWLYRQHPHLARAPYAEQNRVLVEDAFSGVHMIAPYLDELGYDSQLVVANCGHAQFAWLREHGLPVEQANDLMWRIVRQQIEEIDPDVLYLSEPVQFPGAFLRTLPKKPRLVLGWRAANIPQDIDWHGFDVMLSSLSRLREAAVKLGARYGEDFAPGIPERIYRSVRGIQPDHDVVFPGQLTLGQHPRRNYLLSRIAEVAARGDFNCALHLSGDLSLATPDMERFLREPVYGLAMHRALRSGRIAFDGRGNIGLVDANSQEVVDLANQESGNMRIFEATGSGVFLLTEYFPNLQKHFEIGKEIEVFHDDSDLIDKIRYYIAHPREREDIAERGLQRCLREHSMGQRIHDFDRIVRKHLALADQESTASQPNEDR